MIRGCFSLMAALSLAGLGACGDDAADELEEGSTSTAAPATDADTSAEAGASAQTAARRRDDRVEQCLDQVEAGDRCGECACERCIDELEVCEPDPSCRAIRECAHEVRCTGVACLGPCGDVIKKHGGPFGRSSRLAHAIGLCVDKRCEGPC